MRPRRLHKKEEQRLANQSEDRVSSKAMLVRLRISTWNAKVSDESVSNEVADRHNAAKRSGRYVKNLFPQGSDSYDRVHQVCNKARTFHYHKTLPGLYEGTRILPADMYMEYIEGIRERRDELREALQAFLEDYPNLKKAARKKMGSLFNDDDYPDREGLADRFAIHTSFFPLPSSADFNVALDSSEDTGEIKEQIDQEVQKALEEATGDLWSRMYSSIENIAERLSDPDARFKRALIDNMLELCDALPKLNVTGDEKLEELARQMKRSFSKYDVQDIRKDQDVRKEAAKKASKMQKKMEGLMSS